MLRIPWPNSDASLLLTPRWGELAAYLQVSLLAALCLLPVLLILWLYTHELKLVSKVTATGLLMMRLTVLFLILFLVLLQPVAASEHTDKIPGRVLIAVDRSDSIGVTDPQRPPLDKLRLARALKLWDNPDTQARIEEWVRAYEAGGSPKWVRDDEFPNDPERRRVTANDRQALHDRVCGQVDALTRGDVAKRLLAPDGVKLLDAISARHHVEVIGFAQDAWDSKPDQLDELFKPPQPADAGKPGQRASAFTDLRLPLEQGLKRSGQEQGKILGVVVLTDGQHNWGASPVKKAIELGEHQMPVYPVALGARQAPPDVALVGITAPPAVFKDVDAPVEARYKVTGLPAQEITVELQRPGQPPLVEKIKHDGTDRYYTVRFQARLEQVGSQTLTVTAKPVKGETREDNNGRPVVINVADDKAKVLLIDGEARWEYHYLATALERDRTMQVKSVVFDQPRLGTLPEEELVKIGNPARTLPNEPDAFASYDCIILGDTAPDQLTPADRTRLEKYVADRGGTLVLLAGKRSMPLAFGDGGKPLAEQDPILRLLPVEGPHAVSPVNGFPVTLTEEGKLASFLQMDPEADKSLTRWAELPRHYWGVVGRAKPGATTLAWFDDGKEVKKEDRAEHEKDNALVVRQNYGFGRVLFVGLDSTWRWRYRIGDLYHHRFWGQSIRWAASDKPLVAGNDSVRFGTREPVYRQGQDIDVTVRLADEVQPPAPGSTAGARILKPDGNGGETAVAVVPVAAKEAQPRVLEGKVRDLPPGQYQIELAIPELADKLQGKPGPDGKPERLRASFTVTQPDGEEMVELATNWPLLEDVAGKSGGKVFTPETAGELVELLKAQGTSHTERWEFPLWQSWFTFALAVLVLTVEWVARKMAGLP
jgi:hypothetical protein